MLRLLDEQKIWIKENNFLKKDYKIIGIKETKKLKEKWDVTFLSGVKNREILHKCSVCNKDKRWSYNWHAFSYKEIEAEEVKGDFLKKKLTCMNSELYLIWEECNSNGLIMNSEIIRNCKWINTDIYIFDHSFKWTFVVTHEGWFYFKN